MPRAVMSATVSEASSTVSKTARSVLMASGLRESFTVTSVTRASVPSEPTKSAGEIVGAAVALFAADADDFTVGENEFERGDVIGGDAAGERVRAAGIFGDVAADSGGFLARGIGREEEAGLFDGAGDVEIDDAGLNDGALIVEIDFEDAIHAGENEHESAGAGECATGEAGASAAAEDGDVVLWRRGGRFRKLRRWWKGRRRGRGGLFRRSRRIRK